MSCGSKKCMRPGPITSNGYLNFLREYRQKKCGLTPQETVRRGARAWNCLSCEQKAKYRRMGCKVKKKSKRRSKCSSRRRRRRSRPKKRRGCRPKRRRRRSSCKRKRRPKKRCGSRKRRSRCARRPKRRRRCGARKKKCMRGGPITNNGYLNFLRCYRVTNCGYSPTETVRRGARRWCALPQSKKDKYNRMACKRKRSKRRRKRRRC